MNTNQIELKLRGFRAIRNADIILNGITVVAGENGSGKSTISRFLYYVFKTSNEYEELVNRDLRRQLSSVKWFLERFNSELIDPDKRDPFPMKINLPFRDEKDWLEAAGFVFSKYEGIEKNTEKTEDNTNRIFRLKKMLEDILYSDDKEKKINVQELTVSEMFEQLKSYIQDCFLIAADKIRNRPSGLLVNMLKSSFSTNVLPEEYKIVEYGVPVISEKDRIEEAHSVRHVAYIDTPMSLGVHTNKYKYWDDTNTILTRETQQKPGSDYGINAIIRSDIIKGDVSYESTALSEEFIYKREDGSEFNLLDCATGVKSFAILQMMLKSGFLNKYTLLIIDEPESHLHPQWIIEYARLLVLLNKHIGVKFFIASHNPDMVSAIKYISEKEGVDKNLNFYMATCEGESHLYNYTHLGTDIEPIFESFNIALDRINLYGTKNEEE